MKNELTRAMLDAVRFTTRKSSRYVLEKVAIFPKYVAATDGRMMVIIPADFDLPGDSPVLLEPEVLAQIRPFAPVIMTVQKGQVTFTGVHKWKAGRLACFTYSVPVVADPDEKFPPILDVVPPDADMQPIVWLNPAFARTIMEYAEARSGRKPTAVGIEFNKKSEGNHSARFWIRMGEDLALAVLVPVNVLGEEAEAAPTVASQSWYVSPAAKEAPAKSPAKKVRKP